MAHPDVHDEQRLTAKGRATRDRIVQAAAELIVAEGLSASNMDNVRKAASVSGSQLAHYFADKSALIRAVIRRQIGVVLDFHRQPKLGGLDSFDDFERWIDLNMRYLRRIGYFRRHTHLPRAGRAAGEVRRRHPRDVGGRLPAVGRVAREGDSADEGRRRSSSPTPIRDSWRWSSSAPTKVAAHWPSPIGRSGRTPTPLDSPSTICACSPPIRPNARAAPATTSSRRRRTQDSRCAEAHVNGDSTSRLTRKGLATRARIVERRRPADVRARRRQHQHRRGA